MQAAGPPSGPAVAQARPARRTDPRARAAALPAGGSVLWPAAVAAAFTACQLLLVVPGTGLGWDETVYVSQVSPQAPAAFFSAPRARGVTFLAAPVTALTDSVTVLRTWLALLSGAGLLLALLPWRRLLPAPVTALAGALFASLWITLFYGPQVMPNLWVALGSLAAVGCFLNAVRAAERTPDGTGTTGTAGTAGTTGRAGRAGTADRAAAAGRPLPPGRRRRRGRPGRADLAGLGAAVAVVALMRPSDAVWLVLPLAAAALAVRPWRHAAVLVVLVGGLLLGGAEWAVEAQLRYGGLFTRLERASEIQGGIGLTADLARTAFDDQVRALEGRALCRPCDVPWRYPTTALWWFALPLLTVGGVVAGARTGLRAETRLPVLAAGSLAVPYLLLIDYAAPRFLLPSYALLAVPVAVLVTAAATAAGPRLRPVVAAVTALVLAGHLAVQFAVLDRAVERNRATRQTNERIAAALHDRGVRPPCTLTGQHAVPLAFHTGCASRQDGGHDGSITDAGLRALARAEPLAVLVAGDHSPPGWARDWPVQPLPDLPGVPDLRAHLSPTAVEAASRPR
ncbi:hypothetical protein [Streptomyces thermolineatus]|uniref:hypothetical protein n=1 Tax=Streptomyces thermolineatus TaxID=44033 RepID=UPI00384F6D29